jgi:hypothetical protein
MDAVPVAMCDVTGFAQAPSLVVVEGWDLAWEVDAQHAHTTSLTITSHPIDCLIDRIPPSHRIIANYLAINRYSRAPPPIIPTSLLLSYSATLGPVLL